MELVLFDNIYQNKKILVTGHTGFKGAWLCLWLELLKAEVHGISLPITEKQQHFKDLKLKSKNYFGDINDYDYLFEVINQVKPEIIFHLAAQSLVKQSYINPIKTFQSNLIGSLNVYEASKNVDSVKVIISTTTDKVYQNNDWVWGYRENDRLGGNDPYSASKACVEIMTDSYKKSFLQDNKMLISTTRAGNVIGGGDWADDRLIPDIMRAYQNKVILKIRKPKAVRPWQHVLDALSGYLLLGELLLKREIKFAESWNFGPELSDAQTVEIIINKMLNYFSDLRIETEQAKFEEAQILRLDCSKAKQKLCWKPTWNVNQAIEMTALWYKEYIENSTLLSRKQLNQYLKDAGEASVNWIN